VHVSSERFHYLDNLRAVAMLLGVFLHAALAYAEPARSIWIATDRSGSVAIDAGIWFIHLFRMSLFFLLSGYFGKLLWSRRGGWAYLKGRLIRIALPFVLFYPFLWGASMVVIVFALSYLKEPLGIIGLIAESIKKGQTEGEQETFTLMHLWFLYYLMMFVLLSIPLANLKFEWLRQIIRNPLGLSLLPLVLACAVLGTEVPLPAPESFWPAVWPFLFYGTFYWVGWQMFGQEALMARWERMAALIFVGCVTLYVPYYWLLPRLEIEMLLQQGVVSQPPWQKVCLALLTGYLSLGLTISSLGLGRRFLNSNRATLRFLADASYWIYLVHLPLVLALQTFLIPFAISIWLKLLTVVVATMFFSMLSYLVLVRYTPLGWMLHGKREFP
jgi:peptidoglycan/LPS O-acetylase OafA/YrhL